VGLFKKYIEKMQAGAPDYEGEIRKALQPTEQLLGIGYASHAAPELKKSGVGGNKLIGAAINAATEAHSKSKHLSGAADSCAFAIPRNAPMMVAISDQRVSFWDFGMMMTDVPPREALAFPRSSVASIAATGDKDAYGFMTRFSFVDESYADMRVMEQPTYPAFAEAAARISP
jgi:hypothetical protein